MEDILAYSLSLVFLLAFGFWLQTRKQHKNLPPSPPAVPILGHLHLLKQPLHRTLHNFSQKYGPIISLRFGCRLVIVVSSPSAVEECFSKNDVVFANHPLLTISKYLGFNHTNSLVTAPYGDHWRNLRRLSSLEIFSSSRLNVFLATRRDEIKFLLRKLYRVSSHEFTKVQLKPMFEELTFNIIMRMVAGKRYCGEDVAEIDETRQFRAIVSEIFECAEFSYLGDFLPILKWVDYQGFLKTLAKLGTRSNRFMQGLIDEHRGNKGSPQSGNTMIGHLLSLQELEPEVYTDEIVKGLALNIILGAIDTSAVTLEWAMANLINHPEVLEKAKNELDIQIGQECLMDESHLSKSTYLQNIISETLRLYPSAPLLVPHLSSNECTVGGYNVPSNTMLFVNAWAIQRDPNLWDDPMNFRPERFQGDHDGEAYKFMPFGLGRRACPGMGLANRVIGWTLGSLIQCFEWKRVDAKKIDMTEGNGLNMPKAEKLEVMCRARDIANKVLSSV